MKTVGIIAELNPFHNGHQYIIRKAKQITHADHVVILCSGNYVQRGAPAVINKYDRAKMALQNGASAVFELPVVYSTASAELFARAAIAFFEQLQCIDYLCFGCETDDMQTLFALAEILYKEPEGYQKNLYQALQTGLSFPKARQQALVQYCNENNLQNLSAVEPLFSKPNTILAIEYLKALQFFQSDIKPLAIRRQGADYHSLDIQSSFASATALRQKIKQQSLEEIRPLIPLNCFPILECSNKVYFEDFDLILGERLIRQNDFSEIYGISEDLSHRIQKTKSQYVNIKTYLDLLHSKNYTYSAISRALLHLCLGIRKEQVDQLICNGYHFYARLLGFQKSSEILSEIKAKSLIPLISRLSTFYHQSYGAAKEMLNLCIDCDNIYRMIITNKTGNLLPTEFESQIIVQ